MLDSPEVMHLLKIASHVLAGQVRFNATELLR